ncbi:L-threonylcarbamoyladenylate synthase [uncultured Alistipes sp.]|uniref:L-threonylcarbamoyladenylate synthase n=1 Tax=uncultured Alistipes sp. TaxID=538949 RepID=UPI0026216EAA|nr:L-threonylcarbamoyladenylate synthase [uncultured Alistipes sp.]
MIVRIYPQNPAEREVQRVVETLERDGVIVYPTDSVYAYGCSLHSPRGLERLKQLTGKRNDTLTILCDGISRIAEYCKVDNNTFRILKRNLPGAVTFLLEASSRMPDKALQRRRTIGVRIPDNAIACAIVQRLGCPLVTASLKSDDDAEYMTDPELIQERYGDDVALVVNGGYGTLTPTTVVDLTRGEPEIIRQGAAELI